MVVYNFKKITPVPDSKALVDVVLTRTQRKTPTIIRRNFKITRIRQFYMRKIKFAQQTFHDKITKILEDFPVMNDIHPFYADLMNVLYDKDHFKLALGQLSTARNIIDNIAQDYTRLMKYGDSLYRCKMLKRAALGRMATVCKKLGTSLSYLEYVRQHLARLPNIDPNTRTLILCGYPSVGKSSFLNTVTRANVDVQAYPCTTKSLLVGHTDYKYLPWQLIDTPGILDRPLLERNTIEMQSITALAHLRAAVLYILDPSEECGFTLEDQLSLFNSVKPLFANKPVMLIWNKIDVCGPADLPADRRALIDACLTDSIPLVMMSTATHEGIADVKEAACGRLLEERVQRKIKGPKVQKYMNRVHVATPVGGAGKNPDRPSMIPAHVAARRAAEKAGEELEELPEYQTERDIQAENGGAGVYYADLKKWYDLRDPEHKFDVVPELLNGQNIADFIDPEIEAKLEELEREEEARVEMLAADRIANPNNSVLSPEMLEVADEIKERKTLLKVIRGSRRMRRVPRKDTLAMVLPKEALAARGVDADVIYAKRASKDREDVETGSKKRAAITSKVMKRAAARSVDVKKVKESKKTKTGKAIISLAQQRALKKDDRNIHESIHRRDGRGGFGDRNVENWMPKHLYSGTRGFQADRR